MKLREHAFLADENFDPDVVSYLRSAGWRIQTVAELGLGGHDDIAIIRAANAAGRVLLTHDGDFGALAVASGEPVVGIVFIRPGHIASAFTIATFEAVLRQDLDVRPPFILVARRKEGEVTIRVRQLSA